MFSLEELLATKLPASSQAFCHAGSDTFGL
jgi:hypothetical protein